MRKINRIRDPDYDITNNLLNSTKTDDEKKKDL